MKAIENITDFELMTARAWPAKEIKKLDGWMIRANDGITWRANTVLPLDELTTMTMNEAFEMVMKFYKERGLPPAFKITSASKPDGLDSELDQRGFVKDSETYVQTTPIDNMTSTKSSVYVQIEEDMNSDWIATYCATREIEEFELKTRLDIMKRALFPKGFTLGILDGQNAGVGLGVLQGEWLALFAIRTVDIFRRKGIATAVNRALARWAKDQGAKNAYLQVEASNSPALSLYSSLGFKTYYNYWYRILPLER